MTRSHFAVFSYCHWLHSRAIAATFSNAAATATKRGIKMGSSENFCLRWNDFESNVSGAFRELRAESDFFDVTLTCDDTNANSRRPMQAHKVILSACSNLFKQMLRYVISCSQMLCHNFHRKRF